MQLSHSRIETYKNCPRQFKYRYIDNLTTLPTDDPASPLTLGHALHTGIEKDVSTAIEEYYSNYPVINDNHITETLKLEYLIPKVKKLLPSGENEVKIEDEDFIGFIDYLVPVEKELKYNYKDNYLLVEGVSNTEKIGTGYYVYTSGLGGVFPSGILIGMVENITTDEYGLTKIIYVSPAVNFSDINYVAILKRKELKK